jgi:hypothetical protein
MADRSLIMPKQFVTLSRFMVLPIAMLLNGCFSSAEQQTEELDPTEEIADTDSPKVAEKNGEQSDEDQGNQENSSDQAVANPDVENATTLELKPEEQHIEEAETRAEIESRESPETSVSGENLESESKRHQESKPSVPSSQDSTQTVELPGGGEPKVSNCQEIPIVGCCDAAFDPSCSLCLTKALLLLERWKDSCYGDWFQKCGQPPQSYPCCLSNMPSCNHCRHRNRRILVEYHARCGA